MFGVPVGAACDIIVFNILTSDVMQGSGGNSVCTRGTQR